MWLMIVAGLVLVLLIAGLLLGRGRCTPGDDGADAMEILRQRYARGEIDQATFRKMKSALKDD